MFAALWTALGGARLLGWLAAGLTLLASLFAAMASLKSAGRAEQRAADAAKTARIRDEQIHVIRPDPGELDERLRSGRFNLNPCPPVVAYRQEVQIQAADELQALPPDAVLRRMMTDYAVMREQARLCR